MLKIGYFADGKWSHNAFEKIIADKNIKIEFICVRYDSEDFTLRDLAAKHSLPLLKHKNINSEEFINQISGYNCDLLVSMSFNQIFKKKIIDLTPKGIINCHAGKLPYYRGRNILNWALINDEKEFGITVHFVNDGIDTGDIILQRVYDIEEHDTYATLLEHAFTGCAEILYDSLKLFLNSEPIIVIPQNPALGHGFYCGKREAGDEIINWNQTSRELYNFIRAICAPGPKATTSLNGHSVKINQSTYLKSAPVYKGIPGQIIGKTDKGYIVKTLDSYIEIFDIESNCKLKIGDRLK